jgi:hypothetical protein
MKGNDARDAASNGGHAAAVSVFVAFLRLRFPASIRRPS